MEGRRRGGGQLIRTAPRVVVREINLPASLARVAGAQDHRQALLPSSAACCSLAPSASPAQPSDGARTLQAPLDHNTRRAPHKKRVPPPSTTFLLHLDTCTRINPHLTLPQLLTHSPPSPQPRFPHFQKCLPKLLRRLPPPAARPRLERLPRRRRRLARRPLLPLATRRSAPSPGRRPIPRTSTRVSFATMLASLGCAQHLRTFFVQNGSDASQCSSRSTPTLVFPTVPCPS